MGEIKWAKMAVMDEQALMSEWVLMTEQMRWPSAASPATMDIDHCRQRRKTCRGNWRKDVDDRTSTVIIKMATTSSNGQRRSPRASRCAPASLDMPPCDKARHGD